MGVSVKEEVQNQIQKRNLLNDKIKTMIIERLNLELKAEEIEDDAPLFGMGLGLDSIDALELSVGVEELFDVQISDDQMDVFRSINTLVDHIQSESGGGNAS
ncbi:MAG: acyl carrier protein [Spirochaetales bacterium]|nr:acyl carrier protein [Spirochaetales bacterium]